MPPFPTAPSRTLLSSRHATLSSLARVSRPAGPPPIDCSSRKAVQPRRLAGPGPSRAHSHSAREPPRTRRQRSSLPLAAAAAGLVLVGGGTGYWFLSHDGGAVLAPDRWTPVTVTAVERLTHDTSLLRLDVPKSVLPAALVQAGDDVRPILSLYVKEPTLQIQRAYTPLSAKSFNRDGSATLELVVKRYPDGEVSRYLHRLGPGDQVEIRAPIVTWYYRPSDWDQVVFIAGGTGVTPAVQCINDSPASSSASPTVSLVYASARPADAFLRPDLDALRARGHVSDVLYHVDRLDTDTDHDASQQRWQTLGDDTRVGRIDRASLERFVGRKDPSKRRVVVVCGPEGMINAVAGPRGRNFSQGKVGGILRELGYSEHEVVKL
ncbi:hypothetical protein JCM11491_006343 [Sporobolomyces phaffii]